MPLTQLQYNPSTLGLIVRKLLYPLAAVRIYLRQFGFHFVKRVLLVAVFRWCCILENVVRAELM
jgi:hypothetical protein